MKIYTLLDAEEWLSDLITKLDKSARATETDKQMSRYVLEIIQDRIKEKDNGEHTESKPSGAVVREKVTWQAGELFAIPAGHDT
jgi:hypothetical protein